MSSLPRHFLAIALLLAIAPTSAAAFSVGVLAPEGARTASRAWDSTYKHLVAALPDETTEFRYFDIPALRAAVSRKDVDFVLVNSGLYIELESAFGASRIVTLESLQALSPTEAIASTILARADRSDLRTLSDLRGKRVVAVGPDAFGGWQVALGEFGRAGLDADGDLRPEFVGFPMQTVVARVAAGDFDAAIVRNCVLEGMVSRG